MRVIRLQTNHVDRPLGFDMTRALLSYAVEDSAGARQTAAQIQIALAPDESAIVWDSGRQAEGIDNLGWELPLRLLARTRYYWRARVWTDAGETAVSEWTWFETAKGADEPWQARFITAKPAADRHPLFYRRFQVDRPLASARMYCLGLGVYEAYLNGMKLGDEVLLPGLHAYDSYLQYQTFALEPSPGENELAFWLGDGWYKGRYGLKAGAPRYGEDYALICELHLRYQDGGEEIIGTDEGWRARVSTVTMDGIYAGESVDARLEAEDAPIPVRLLDTIDTKRLTARVSPYIRVQEERKPTLVPGETAVLDFGQNMAGWVSFVCRAPKGTVIRLRYAEHLLEGRPWRGNLRKAAATFTYISDGQARLARPRFTYFGFRYVEVEGWPGELNPADFIACSIYSQMERTGWIETSDERVNRLFENALWSQKSNFLDVPTDCPQRDERMGWTGDIQIFCDTALYNMDCAAFLRKFLRDLSCERRRLGGAVPCVVPMAGYRLAGVAAWGDAATVIPWQCYLHSGDVGFLQAQLDSMKGWIDHIQAETQRDRTGFLWTKGQQLGDWLALDGNSVYGGTDRGFVASCYYYYSASLTGKAARVLHRDEDARRYGALAENIKRAIQAEYFTPGGRLAIDTQTAYVLALFLDLVPDDARERAALALRNRLIEAGTQLQTGFVGTPWLLPALCDSGSADLAYGLLLREDYPSWLYEVASGATTIWERWNSIEPDGQPNSDGMNSLNHYAYGSVVGWMYRYMFGLSPLEEAPGFRSARIAPVPDRRIAWAKMRMATGHGAYAVEWRWQGDELTLRVRVPFGCTARLLLPGERQARSLRAGAWEYHVAMPEDAPLGLDAPWRELMERPACREAIERVFPRAVRGIAFQNEMHTMAQVTASPFSELSREEIQRLSEEIIRAQRADALQAAERRPE